MPLAVTHILVPIILMSLFRDWYNSKHKDKLSLHYVLIAGLGGVLPDIDIPVFILTDFIGFPVLNSIFAITHTLFFPALFLILFVGFKSIPLEARICNIGKHRLRLSTIFLMLAFGTLIHVVLDTIFGTRMYLLYPLSLFDFGLNPLRNISYSWNEIMAILDGVLLVIWIVYLELKHKISDFI